MCSEWKGVTTSEVLMVLNFKQTNQQNQKHKIKAMTFTIWVLDIIYLK